MLSNTATPIYYGQFREKVKSGEIPVCLEISMEMNRIDALIEDPEIYYDDQAINGFIETTPALPPPSPRPDNGAAKLVVIEQAPPPPPPVSRLEAFAEIEELDTREKLRRFT